MPHHSGEHYTAYRSLPAKSHFVGDQALTPGQIPAEPPRYVLAQPASSRARSMQTHSPGHALTPGHSKTSPHHSAAVHAAHLPVNSKGQHRLGAAKAHGHRPAKPPRTGPGTAALPPSRSMLLPTPHPESWLPRMQPMPHHSVQVHRSGCLLPTNFSRSVHDRV